MLKKTLTYVVRKNIFIDFLLKITTISILHVITCLFVVHSDLFKESFLDHYLRY